MVNDAKELAEIAKKIRRLIIEMLAEAGSGHPGGSLSAADIITALYFAKMRHNPRDPQWKERDRFVLSKGHAAPALYAALMLSGYIDEDIKLTLRKTGSPLQGHPDMRKVAGVEISTGSLGQGISVAVGMALAAKMDKLNSRVYCLTGDGECQEGQLWEAAMAAAHYKLDNLIVITDRNHLQIDGNTEQVMAIEPLADKWRAFGFEVLEIDGHDLPQILAALDRADTIKGRPTYILANTVKGKGVSFMENKVNYHGVAPTKEEAIKALAELA
ncbi:transketolase N-terminal subunit [Candidatus Termititenax aidoneus]|uniref:Transketolase N-terminal subunit n=1 Tax=Termititenax aidoneus TaxID=2218524 RepID=A0A388TCM3_TERA1|nr:transketolase N-terminal subunit [Candidatus Termititenax aidoneus]